MASQLGLLLVMFQIGLEFDFAHLGERRNSTTVVAFSLAGRWRPSFWVWSSLC